VIQKYPVLPALKAIVARALADEEWATVRPPLVELTTAQRESLAAELDAHGFALAA
jgi:4-hydroxy-tetrahydrodipicolinate synthase